MKLFPLMLSLVFMMMAAPGRAGAEPNMQDGQWEITSTMNMPGMPAPMPPVKQTQCITKKDMVPQTQQKNQECTVTDTKINGNTVSWSVKCSAEGNDMTGNGNITYKGDTFDGTFIINMKVPGQGSMQMTQNMKGRRLGPCK